MAANAEILQVNTLRLILFLDLLVSILKLVAYHFQLAGMFELTLMVPFSVID